MDVVNFHLLYDSKSVETRDLVHCHLVHDLPIEQGRMARPIVPRYLRRCTLCSRRAVGDERHFMLECPQFDDIRAQYPKLLPVIPCAT